MHPLYPKQPLFLFFLLAAGLTQPRAGLATANRVPTPELPNFNGEVLAQTAEDRMAEAERLLSEGLQFLQTSQFQAALDNLQQALVIYRELGNRIEEGVTLLGLGRVYDSFGQYPQAIDLGKAGLSTVWGGFTVA